MMTFMLNVIRRSLRERHVLLDLSSLGDHHLDDIGLSHSEVLAVTCGMIERP